MRDARLTWCARIVHDRSMRHITTSSSTTTRTTAFGGLVR